MPRTYLNTKFDMNIALYNLVLLYLKVFKIGVRDYNNTSEPKNRIVAKNRKEC